MTVSSFASASFFDATIHCVGGFGGSGGIAGWVAAAATAGLVAGPVAGVSDAPGWVAGRVVGVPAAAAAWVAAVLLDSVEG